LPFTCLIAIRIVLSTRYFASSQRALRLAVMARLLPDLRSVSSDHHAAVAKQQTRRAKYARQRVERVRDNAAAVQRCAADAIGRAMPPLLDACYHRCAANVCGIR
jgi:hypothetical protein